VITSELQPDQRPLLWDDHVLVYESVFEPFSSAFARDVVRGMNLRQDASILDVGCGSGTAALKLAAQNYTVTAIDASTSMIERVRARSEAANVIIDARVMDGQHLEFADATFDAALSVFGVILFPDAVRGLAEVRRVVKRGGTVGIVTWTEPQNYELAALMRQAILAVKPDLPPSKLPAQLRYQNSADFRALFRDAGFDDVSISASTAQLTAPSARWLADRLAFAPGMASMLDGVGNARPAVLDAFVAGLEKTQGTGPIALGGVAFLGIARVA
jgi:ubiquinone/menaquinone biosynthesis C-methylase UbiE